MNLYGSIDVELDRKSLQKIYFIFIRPFLEYADVVDNCTKQQSNCLEKMQRGAGRIVSRIIKLAEMISCMSI